MSYMLGVVCMYVLCIYCWHACSDIWILHTKCTLYPESNHLYSRLFTVYSRCCAQFCARFHTLRVHFVAISGAILSVTSSTQVQTGVFSPCNTCVTWQQVWHANGALPIRVHSVYILWLHVSNVTSCILGAVAIVCHDTGCSPCVYRMSLYCVFLYVYLRVVQVVYILPCCWCCYICITGWLLYAYVYACVCVLYARCYM